MRSEVPEAGGGVERSAGSKVNLEVDLIARYLERMLPGG